MMTAMSVVMGRKEGGRRETKTEYSMCFLFACETAGYSRRSTSRGNGGSTFGTELIVVLSPRA